MQDLFRSSLRSLDRHLQEERCFTLSHPVHFRRVLQISDGSIIGNELKWLADLLVGVNQFDERMLPQVVTLMVTAKNLPRADHPRIVDTAFVDGLIPDATERSKLYRTIISSWDASTPSMKAELAHYADVRRHLSELVEN